MLTDDGVVKILDFGLAKLSGQTRLTKADSTLGTVAYMSPEQTVGEDVDHRTDIWSLAVVLFEMLSRQLPFKGEYEQVFFYSILNEDPQSLTGLRSGIPLELEQIINKCLEKKASDRYQRMEELIVDLQRLNRDLGSKVTIAKKIKSSKQTNKMNKISYFIGAILLIVIIVIGGYFIIKNLQKTGDISTQIISPSEWKNSIAVLPFKDFSQKKDQEHFCYGITDDLIGRLAKIEGLKVTALTSVMRYKDVIKDIKEIGQELGVANVIEGSIQREKDRIRINAQLINVEDGFHLWSEKYDKKLESIFDLQDSISQAIAKALEVRFSERNLITIKAERTQSVEAFEFYMKGRLYNRKFFGNDRLEDFRMAEDMLNEAIKIDPQHAESYALLTDLYNNYYYKFAKTEEDKQKYFELQEKHINKALSLNPNLVMAHTFKGHLYYEKGEIDKAYESYRKGVNIDPNSSQANDGMHWIFNIKGLYNQAIYYLTKSIEIDPFNQYAYFQRAVCYFVIGEYDKTWKDFQKLLEINPDHIYGLRNYIRRSILTKNYETAEKLLVRIQQLDTTNYNYLKGLYDVARGNNVENINSFLRGDLFNFKAYLYSNLGMKDEAIRLLNEEYYRNIEMERSTYLYLKKGILYDNLQDDARFQELLSKQKKLYEKILEKYGNGL